MPSEDPAVWAELARRVYARRLELGMHTQRDLADRAGVALNTVGRIESGAVSSRRSPSWPKLEAALEWVPGYISTLVEGLEPDVATIKANPNPVLKRGVVSILVEGLPDSTGAEILALYDDIQEIYLDFGYRPPLMIGGAEGGVSAGDEDSGSE